jgi:three-Cys-motif partner protein
MFSGPWTQQKLEILSKYLRAYRLIFDKNPKARFFETSYVNAFAGTGEIPRPMLRGFFKDDPDLLKAEEEFRKGSVKRALEVDPPFHHYVFIEKDSDKCKELEALKKEHPKRDIKIICDDANTALLNWCKQLDTKKARAVVFLDPLGACVDQVGQNLEFTLKNDSGRLTSARDRLARIDHSSCIRHREDHVLGKFATVYPPGPWGAARTQ